MPHEVFGHIYLPSSSCLGLYVCVLCTHMCMHICMWGCSQYMPTCMWGCSQRPEEAVGYPGYRQTFVSCCVGTGKSSPGFLEQQPGLLTLTHPSLQPYCVLDHVVYYFSCSTNFVLFYWGPWLSLFIKRSVPAILFSCLLYQDTVHVFCTGPIKYIWKYSPSLQSWKI